MHETNVTPSSFAVERVPAKTRRATAAELVARGLGGAPKTLPPLLFYDARGSQLFEEICRLDEYYVTRTERRILEERAAELASLMGPEVTVAELGSGSAEKTDVLLAALLEGRERLRYVAVDISEEAILGAARRLSARHEKLEVHGIVAEYGDGLTRLVPHLAGQGLVVFLGSNIGNFDPPRQRAFLQAVRGAVRPEDLLLLGVDLVKDAELLERAYDDAKGVTAAFNLNVLARINRELGGHFDLARFEHRALWNAHASRIEMHLVSRVEQEVRIDALGASYRFEAGETIHTENSYKLTPEGIDALARASGWRVMRRFTDEARLFSLNVFAPAGGEA